MSTTKGVYRNDNLKLDVNGKPYTVKIEAPVLHYYEPMVMYYKDGTGDPGCDEIEVDNWEAEWKDEDGNIVEETAEMEDALNDFLYSLDDTEFIWDVPLEYDEPDREDCE